MRVLHLMMMLLKLRISLDGNVLLYLEILSGMWKVDEHDALFKMIIELWVTI